MASDEHIAHLCQALRAATNYALTSFEVSERVALALGGVSPRDVRLAWERHLDDQYGKGSIILDPKPTPANRQR